MLFLCFSVNMLGCSTTWIVLPLHDTFASILLELWGTLTPDALLGSFVRKGIPDKILFCNLWKRATNFYQYTFPS